MLARETAYVSGGIIAVIARFAVKRLQYRLHVGGQRYPATQVVGDLFRFVVFLISFVSGLTLYNLSFSFERTGALPQALDAARESLRIWRASLPAAHQHVSDSEARVRRLEATRR